MSFNHSFKTKKTHTNIESKFLIKYGYVLPSPAKNQDNEALETLRSKIANQKGKIL